MTETVTENAEAAEQAPSFPDAIAEATFNMINGLIDERNSLVGKVNAVKGDELTLKEQLRESSTNPQAVAARAQVEELREALSQAEMDLDAAIQPELEAVRNDSEGATTQIEESIKEHDNKIKPALTFFKKMYGEDLAKSLKSLERLKGFSTRGSGSTGRRIRGYDATATIDGESTSFENVASLAKWLNVETSELQAKFFEAAGNPEKLADAPDRVDFEVNFVETYDDAPDETKTAQVTCVRQVKDEAPAEDDAASE